MSNFASDCLYIEDREHYFAHLTFINMYSDLISEEGIEATEFTKLQLEGKLLETFTKYTSSIRSSKEVKAVEEIKKVIFQPKYLEECIRLKIKTGYLYLKNGKYNLTKKGIGLATCKSV